MLKLEGLKCGYGSVAAVHDVAFDVPAGSVFALLGPNGAGKTSTIMAIMGHVDIQGGRILLAGEGHHAPPRRRSGRLLASRWRRKGASFFAISLWMKT